MKATVNTELLSKEIRKYNTLVNRKPIVPIMSCLLFTFSKNSLNIRGGDFETTYVTNIDCECNEDFSFPIEYEDISGVCGCCVAPLSFSIKDGLIKIKSGSSSFSFTLIGDASHYPSEPDDSFDFSVDVNWEFFHELSIAALFKSKSDNDVLFNNACASFGKNKISLAGTNNFIFYVKDIEAETEGREKIMIPDSFISATKGLQNGVFSTGEKYIRLEYGKSIIYSIMSEYKFVNYEQIMDKEQSYNVSVNKSDILSSLKKMSLAKDILLSITKLNFTDGFINIESSDNDFGKSVTDKMPFEGETETPLIKLNTTQAIQVFSNVDGEEIELCISGEKDPIFIRPKGDNSARFLIRPLFTNN